MIFFLADPPRMWKFEIYYNEDIYKMIRAENTLLTFIHAVERSEIFFAQKHNQSVRFQFPQV